MKYIESRRSHNSVHSLRLSTLPNMYSTLAYSYRHWQRSACSRRPKAPGTHRGSGGRINQDIRNKSLQTSFYHTSRRLWRLDTSAEYILNIAASLVQNTTNILHCTDHYTPHRNRQSNTSYRYTCYRPKTHYSRSSRIVRQAHHGSLDRCPHRHRHISSNHHQSSYHDTYTVRSYPSNYVARMCNTH
jgi:hypothetical protein